MNVVEYESRTRLVRAATIAVKMLTITPDRLPPEDLFAQLWVCRKILTQLKGRGEYLTTKDLKNFYPYERNGSIMPPEQFFINKQTLQAVRDGEVDLEELVTPDERIENKYLNIADDLLGYLARDIALNYTDGEALLKASKKEAIDGGATQADINTLLIERQMQLREQTLGTLAKENLVRSVIVQVLRDYKERNTRRYTTAEEALSFYGKTRR